MINGQLLPSVRPDQTAQPTRPAHPLRWVALLLVSLLLHFLLLAAAGTGMGALPAISSKPNQVVEAILIFPVAPPLLVKESPKASTPKAPPRSARHRTSSVVQPKVIETQANDVPPTTLTRPAIASLESPNSVSADNVDMPSDLQPAQAVPNKQSPSVIPAPTASVDNRKPDSLTHSNTQQYKTAPPPSATLDYEIRYSTKGSLTRGSGSISWQSDGTNYLVNGKVSKFGLPLSTFSSDGIIDATGLAPTLYKEKNVRKPETTTHFLRDARQSISFSASTTTYPLVVGTQDRASVLWQITSIARGDLEAFVPGNILIIKVAGVRDADLWSIRILGQENIVLENESVLAWHLVRAPQPGTYDRQIDIWVAPAMNWYPVKLRYTEPNGDYLDFSMATLRIGQAP